MPATGLGIFAGVTGALMSILFQRRLMLRLHEGMKGIVECVISAIWSVFFLPVGALVAGTMAASGGGMRATTDGWWRKPVHHSAYASCTLLTALLHKKGAGIFAGVTGALMSILFQRRLMLRLHEGHEGHRGVRHLRHLERLLPARGAPPAPPRPRARLPNPPQPYAGGRGRALPRLIAPPLCSPPTLPPNPRAPSSPARWPRAAAACAPSPIGAKFQSTGMPTRRDALLLALSVR
ncbi:MAG: hypothetical protein J3K34DRAFT_526539 [Monoraphidium minutum]|nr:MAG: hypothetical protein J3K34DRAFT_526539 [Monoraphidium minutum]